MPKFMGPQIRHDVKHSDAIINDSKALLDNMQDTMHCVVIYSSMQEFIRHKCHCNTYISDVQLHAMELPIYHGIKVQVEGLDGGLISEICRCTGSQSWHAGD
jgi:hypothetical protein